MFIIFVEVETNWAVDLRQRVKHLNPTLAGVAKLQPCRVRRAWGKCARESTLDVRVNVNDRDMREMLLDKLLGQMKPAEKQKIVDEAVKHFLTVIERGEWGDYHDRSVTKFRSAFESAVNTLAREVIKERLANDPNLRKALDRAIDEALAVFASDTRSALAQRMAIGLANAITLRDDEK